MYFLWYNWSKKRLIKKYKVDDDKARKGGFPKQGRTGEPEQRVDSEPINTIGLEQLEGGKLLSEATVSSSGKDSNSRGKKRRSIREIFRRRRRKE